MQKDDINPVIFSRERCAEIVYHRKDKADDDVIEERQGTCPKITVTGNCSSVRKTVTPHGKPTGNWRSLVVISWQTHLRQTSS